MKEIVNICVGQAGVNIGSACWELFCLEHGIGPDGQKTESKPDACDSVLFEERPNGRYVPRVLMLDTDYEAIQEVCLKGPQKSLYDLDYVLFDTHCSGSLYSEAEYR